MSLQDYGWSSFFENALEPYAREGYDAGRVVLAHGSIHHLRTAAGEISAEVRGRLRHRAQTPAADDASDHLPAIGDWVAVRTAGAAGRPATGQIHAVLPRRSTLSRKVAGDRSRRQVVAANVDTVFLVMGLDGDFSPRRMERLLLMAWESGARPVVILNKADVAGDLGGQTAAVEAVAPGVPVLATSVLEGSGLDALATWLVPAETVALVGSSGVGKSTLINHLCGHGLMKTREVRRRDERGQHTTSHRQLVRLPSGALLIDNPGIRELQPWASDDSLERTFEDVEELAALCRFRDCSHHAEPGCAVRAAVEDGTLAPERLASLHGLEKELRYLELRRDQRARRLESRKTAALHKAVQRFKPRRF